MGGFVVGGAWSEDMMKRPVYTNGLLAAALFVGCAPAPDTTEADFEANRKELRKDVEALNRYLDETNSGWRTTPVVEEAEGAEK